jgi:hypothetical protein
VQQWDKLVKEGKMISIEVPDHSSLYLSTAVNKEDQEYLARAFWDQRWGRYLDVVKYTGYWAYILVGPPLVLSVIG